MSNKRNSVLYIGVTSNNARRKHKQKVNEGFTSRYNVDKLVYYEEIPFTTAATQREKQMKRWNRDWKIELIEKENPEWRDLSEEF